jgi:hypothetical protein
MSELHKSLFIYINKSIDCNTKKVSIWQIYRNRIDDEKIHYILCKFDTLHRDTVEHLPDISKMDCLTQSEYPCLFELTTDLINVLRDINNKYVEILIYINEKTNKTYKFTPSNSRSATNKSSRIIEYIEKYFASPIKMERRKKKGHVHM